MAVRFDANNEFLSQASVISSFNYSDAYTLAVWYYPVTISSTSNIGNIWLTNTAITAYDGMGQERTSDGSNFFVQTSGGSGLTYNSAALSATTWYHVAMIRSNSALMRGYINGLQFGSDLTGSVSGRAAAERLYIGSPVGGIYINSRYAHAKLWRAALSVEELQREMHSVLPVRKNDLVACWPLINDTADDAGGFPFTQNGTLSYEADPGIAWAVAKPKPHVWWIPPPAVTTSIIPLVRHHMAQQGMA